LARIPPSSLFNHFLWVDKMSVISMMLSLLVEIVWSCAGPNLRDAAVFALQDYVRMLDGQCRMNTGQRVAAGHGVRVG